MELFFLSSIETRERREEQLDGRDRIQVVNRGREKCDVETTSREAGVKASTCTPY